MLRAWRHALGSAALLLAAAFACGAATAAELKLRLLATSDLHMNLLAWDYYQDRPAEDYGLARTATLIRAARAEARNTLLFDNGDLIQGSPLGDQVARVKPLAAGQVHPAMKVLNALGMDAANIGNHEFNFGLPFLRQVIGGAAFPYVSANVYQPDGRSPVFRPWVILERRFTDESGAVRTLKIGVTGFVPPQILLWDRNHLAGRVVAGDMVEAARRVVPEMRAAGADLVLALPHSGFERGETPFGAENAVARLAEVPGIDALMFGHSHGEFPGRFFAQHPKVDLARGTINGVPAVMPGFWGSHLGVIDLVLDERAGRWSVRDARAELRPVFDRATRRPLVEPDPAIAALVADEHAATLATMRAPLAEALAPIHSYFAQVGDDPSVQLVADAQRAYAARALAGTPLAKLPLLSAASPFKTGGRIGWTQYTDIPAGPLALRHVADLYVYPNTLKVVKLTGAQVREWLEMSAGQFNRIDPAGPPVQDLINTGFPSFNFDTLDGLSYRIDVTQPARYERSGRLVAPQARRIVDLRFEGRPLDDAAEFLVVTNNYRASGGGNFPGLDGSQVVLDAPDENREAVVQYLRENRRIAPRADGNWRIQPVPGVTLRFASGAGAIAHLRDRPGVVLVREVGDGSALFELRP